MRGVCLLGYDGVGETLLSPSSEELEMDVDTTISTAIPMRVTRIARGGVASDGARILSGIGVHEKNPSAVSV